MRSASNGAARGRVPRPGRAAGWVVLAVAITAACGRADAPAPAPLAHGTGSGVADTAGAPGRRPGDAPLSAVPDEPLRTPPATPVSVRYLVEHRSALDGATVRLVGVVVATQPAGPCSRSENCPPPRLIVADAAAAGRDPRYDVRVWLPPAWDGRYHPGERVELPVEVTATPVAVTLTVRD